jgi:branched-subunit amino acid aminotransferase/4-amino-4-deoxychorismate lyase
VGRVPGRGGQADGIRAKVSSWRRISPDSLIPQSKASGQYLNSVLAKIESQKAGYEEAILLDDHGNVCEGSGENIFVVRDGEIVTPPQSASILDGINRKSVIADRARPRLTRSWSATCARAELYLADEVFLTGRRPRCAPCARSTTTHRRRPAGARHARDPGDLRGRAQRPGRALPRLARRGQGTLQDGMSRRFSCIRIPRAARR